MAKKYCRNKIELHYSFDRLSTMKLPYVYQILVPKKRAGKVKGDTDFAVIGGKESEKQQRFMLEYPQSVRRKSKQYKVKLQPFLTTLNLKDI